MKNKGHLNHSFCFVDCFVTAKFDRPTILKIQAVPKRYGCLKLSWSLSQQQVWMSNLQLNLEVRLTTADSSQRRGQPVSQYHSSVKINFTLPFEMDFEFIMCGPGVMGQTHTIIQGGLPLSGHFSD